MKLAKTQHEAFAQFFEKPTREGLSELIKQSIGEMGAIVKSKLTDA